MTMVAMLLSLGIALLGLAPSIYATQIMGRFVSHGRISTLVTLLIGLGIAMLGELLLRVMRFRVLSTVGAEADEELAHAVFQRSPENEHMRSMILLESVSATYSAGRIAALMDLPTALLYVAALWWVSVDIGVGVCAAIVIAVLLDLAMGRVGSIASAAGNAVRNRVMTANSVESRGAAVADWVDSAIRTGQTGAFREGSISLSNSMVYCVVLTIGAIMVVNDSVGPSALFGAGLLGSRAASIALRMGGLSSELKRGQPAMEAVVRILSGPPPTPDARTQFFAARQSSFSDSAN
jgi:ATP-binding cassette subfamily C protein LapB